MILSEHVLKGSGDKLVNLFPTMTLIKNYNTLQILFLPKAVNYNITLTPFKI